MPDILVRFAFAAIGLVLIHDVVRWNHSWLYSGRGSYPGRWIRNQSDFAQTIWRLWTGLFGALIVIAAVFGTLLYRWT